MTNAAGQASAKVAMLLIASLCHQVTSSSMKGLRNVWRDGIPVYNSNAEKNRNNTRVDDNTAWTLCQNK